MAEKKTVAAKAAAPASDKKQALQTAMSQIEKMYGKAVFYEEAANSIIPDAYEAAIKDCELTFVSMPEFDIVSIDDDGVTFKAKFYVKPEVTLNAYKGLKATKNVAEVTDDLGLL